MTFRPMCNKFFAVTLLGVCASSGVWAADNPGPAAAKPLFVSPVTAVPDAPSFSPAQMDFVRAWISRAVPECPPDLATAAGEKFLGELQVGHPQELDLLLSASFPAREYESALLRQVGVQLTGETRAPLRATVAARRVAALLAADGQATPADSGAGLVEKIRDFSDTQYRRLLEGRMDDDDLELVLKKVRAPSGASAQSEPAKPRELTAQEIVAEFARHNQEGSAAQRLQSYVVEARLTTTAGERQQLLLFKMRPDRFRLMLIKEGLTRYVLAGEGGQFWQQVPGSSPQLISGKAMGPKRYMAEFIDPCLADEGYGYERLPDGTEAGKKFYRITVQRADGSSYVSDIDAATFREAAREDEDKTVTRYSDFRVVAGVTFAFREEITDAQGRHGVLELARITPNAGLIGALFTPMAPSALDYFAVERLLAHAPASGQGQP
jgi:hypothetical protein